VRPAPRHHAGIFAGPGQVRCIASAAAEFPPRKESDLASPAVPTIITRHDRLCRGDAVRIQQEQVRGISLVAGPPPTASLLAVMRERVARRGSRWVIQTDQRSFLHKDSCPWSRCALNPQPGPQANGLWSRILRPVPRVKGGALKRLRKIPYWL
jgi:hypothetical protein